MDTNRFPDLIANFYFVPSSWNVTYCGHDMTFHYNISIELFLVSMLTFLLSCHGSEISLFA